MWGNRNGVGGEGDVRVSEGWVGTAVEDDCPPLHVIKYRKRLIAFPSRAHLPRSAPITDVHLASPPR